MTEQPTDTTPLADSPSLAPEAAPPAQTSLGPESERPSYLLPQFKTVEEQAQAYAAIEQDHAEESQPSAETPEAPPPTPAQFTKFADEFTQTGSLSETSYAELEQRFGLQRDYVDLYIAGLQAKQADYVKAVHAEVGGEEGFKVVGEWARQSLTPVELAAVERALTSGDRGVATLAARGLFARYQDETGREPQLISGDSPERSGLQPFRSTAEVVKAISDPRYKIDPDYRKEVEDRLSISDVI